MSVQFALGASTFCRSRPTSLSRGLFILLLAGVAPATVQAIPYEVGGTKLEVSAVPENAEYMLAEPGFVLFKVANLSDRNLRITVGGDYRNRLGRPDSFKVEVAGADGKKVPQPDLGMQKGGMVYGQKVPAKGEYVFRLFLPQWATFEKPGRYTMTIRRKLELAPDDGTDLFAQKRDNVEVTATATVTIIPTDAAKLGQIIEKLGATACGRNGDNAEQATMMLAAIHDERVIPHFAALAEMPHSTPRYAACRSLGKYNNDQAFESLKKLMTTMGADIRESATTLNLAESGADGVRHAAIIALGQSPHPKALPLFWSFSTDRYYGVRMTVLHKAAELKSPACLAIIKKMTSDENERVHNEAIRYQKLIAKDDPR